VSDGGGRGGAARGAAAWLACVAVAAAQEEPPPAPWKPVVELSTASLQALSSADADEATLLARNFAIRFADGLELRADRVILWGDRDLLALPQKLDRGAADAPLRFGPQVPPAPGRAPLPEPVGGDAMELLARGLHEIYAEGHVFFRQGEESLFATRLYHHLLEQRGVVIDADAYAKSSYGEEPDPANPRAERPRPIDVHVRAGELRSLGLGELQARDAQFSICAYGHPHHHVASGTLRATLATSPASGMPAIDRIALEDNWLALDQTPFLPLPDFSAKLEQGDSLPLKKVRAGHSKRYGTFLQTLWGADLPDAARAIEEGFGFDHPLDLGWELDADVYSLRGPALGPALQWKSPGKIEGEIGGYWVHDRRDEDFGVPYTIEQENRGRAYFRDRYVPAEHWRLDTEVQWFSDEGVQPEYFEKEFKEEKEAESYAHLVRQEDTERWRLLYRNRLNDFQTQTDSLPQGSYDMVGEPLWGMELPGWLRNDDAPAFLRLTQAHDVAYLRVRQEEGSPLSDEEVVRADSLLDLSTTLAFGPIAFRPFTAGRFTAWDEGSADDGDALGRGVGVSGARAELMFHRDFDAWLPALSIDGLRHVVLFDADYANVWESSRDPDELIQVDEVDAITEEEVYVVAMRQRFKTHRRVRGGTDGPPTVVIEDAVELDLEMPLYPHATRDNSDPLAGSTVGQTAGPLRYDTLFRPGLTDRVFRDAYLYSDGEWSFHDHSFDVVNIGAAVQPTLEWTTLASWRVTRGISRVLTGEIDWRLDTKWSLAALEQYDFDQDDGLEHRIEIRRHGHDFTFAMGFARDEGDGDFAYTFTIYPAFLTRGRAEKSLTSGRGSSPSLSSGY